LALVRLARFFLHYPELNPGEHVWNWVKTHEVGRRLPESKLDLLRMVRSAPVFLQRKREVLKGFFRAPNLSYIKAEQFCTS